MAHVTRRIFDQEFLKRLDALSIVSRRVGTGQAKGERRTLRKGSGVEFMDYRPYTVGDDLRYVDWNIYSRLDKLLLKLYVEEEDMCLHLLVDGSASMGFGGAVEARLRAAGGCGAGIHQSREPGARGPGCLFPGRHASAATHPRPRPDPADPRFPLRRRGRRGHRADSVPRPVCPEKPRTRRCRRADGSPGSGRLCRRPQGAPPATPGGLPAPRGE